MHFSNLEGNVCAYSVHSATYAVYNYFVPCLFLEVYCAKLFLSDFIKFPPIVKIFGIKYSKQAKINVPCIIFYFTNTNSRQRITVLNVDVPNCYITL